MMLTQGCDLLVLERERVQHPAPSLSWFGPGGVVGYSAVVS